MPDSIRLVDYFYVTAPDKPGEGARALRTLQENGVDLLAFSGFPEGRKSQLDFVPVDSAAFKAAAKRAKWRVVGPKRGFLVQGDNRIGVVADLMERLAAAKINITAIDAVTVDGRYGAIFWVAPRDVKKASATLGASAAPAAPSA
jgi:predicted amino acid-binding ACT domain protein